MLLNKEKLKEMKPYLLTGGGLYLLLCYFIVQVCAYSAASPKSSFEKILNYTLTGIIKYPFSLPAYPKNAGLFIMLITLALFMGAVYWYTTEVARRHAKDNTECGTSQWNTDFEKWNKVYSDPEGSPNKLGKRNMIMSENVYMSMNTRQTLRNNNIIVIGGSGAGKSRYFVKPNLLEMPINCNFICTDPSGELLKDIGGFLEGAGFKIKVFNLENMKESGHYNPLKYIYTENDVILLVDCILANTTDPNRKGGEDFWEKSQKLMFQAFMFLIWKHGDELGIEKTLNSLVKLMDGCQISESEETSQDKGMTDKYFMAIKEKGWWTENISGKLLFERPPVGLEKDYTYHKPYGENDICVKQYSKFMTGAGKTLKSILISAMARLSTLDVSDVSNLLADDDIEIDKIGDEKTALFVIIPQEHDSFNFLAAMMYTQLFQFLYFHAQNECQGNYIVVDHNEENIKVFNVPHEKCEDDYIDEDKLDEIELDDNWKEVQQKQEIEEEIDVNLGDDEINTGYEDRPVPNTDANNENNTYTPEAFNTRSDEDEEKTRPDTNPGEDIPEVEKQAYEFIERLKNLKPVKRGNKYLLKIPADEKNPEEIIGIYGNKEFAMKRFNAIKAGCKIRRCGLYLPYHVRFMLDEFANIGQIPEFNKKLATMRKYEISCSVILQNLAQIKNMYKDDWGTLIGNCDSFLFLGCPEYDTLEYISKMLGKQTIVVRNRSASKGSKSGTSFSYNKSGRELITPDELRRLKDDECIFILRGEQPFKDKKHQYKTHPNFKYTADYDKNFIYKYHHKIKNRTEDIKNDEHIIENNVTKMNPNLETEEKMPLSDTGTSSNPLKNSCINQAKNNLSYSFTEEVTGLDNLIEALSAMGAAEVIEKIPESELDDFYAETNINYDIDTQIEDEEEDIHNYDINSIADEDDESSSSSLDSFRVNI